MPRRFCLLTDFVAELGAVVDEEFHFALTAVLEDLGLDVAGVGAADRLGVAGVVGATIGDQWNSPNIPQNPSIPSHLPDDLEDTGGGLSGASASGHDVGEGHDGESEDGLVEQHVCRFECGVKEWKESHSESRDFQRECRESARQRVTKLG